MGTRGGHETSWAVRGGPGSGHGSTKIKPVLDDGTQPRGKLKLIMDDYTRPIWAGVLRAKAEVEAWPAWKHTEVPHEDI